MVEWIQNKTLWQWKCWIFLQDKNQKIYPPKHSLIWQKGRCPWSIYPNKNGSLFFLYKIQIQGTNTKTKRYSRSPQRWPRNQTNLFTKAPWQLDIIMPPLLSSIQFYITQKFHSDKSSKKQSRIQKIKKQEPTWELKLSSTNSHLQNSPLSSSIFYFTNLSARSTNSTFCKFITITNYLRVFLQFSSFTFDILLCTLCFMFS